MDYGVAHGFACVVFLPAVIRFNAPVIEERFKELLQILGLPSVETFAERVENLMKKVGALMRLREVGVKAEALPDIVKRGVGRSTAWNPKPMGEEDILRICRAVL
jgi:alcohol dehydrogenase class IV